MFTSISQLIEDIEAGDKYMKVYKQMKMYNDEDLNPVLYQNKSSSHLTPKPKHILLIRLSAMGDVAMTVPVLRALVLQHPEVKSP